MRLSQPDDKSADSKVDDLRNDIDRRLTSQTEEEKESSNQRLQIHTSFGSGKRISTVLTEKEGEEKKGSYQETTSSIKLQPSSHTSSDVFEHLENQEIKDHKSLGSFPNSRGFRNQSGRLHFSPKVKLTEGFNYNHGERSPNRGFNRERRNVNTRDYHFEKFRGRGRDSGGFHSSRGKDKCPPRYNKTNHRHPSDYIGRQESSKFYSPRKEDNSYEASRKARSDERTNPERTCTTKNEMEKKELKHHSTSNETKSIESAAVNQAIHGMDDFEVLTSKTTQWKPTPMPKVLQITQDNSLGGSEKVETSTIPIINRPEQQTSSKSDVFTKKDEKTTTKQKEPSSSETVKELEKAVKPEKAIAPEKATSTKKVIALEKAIEKESKGNHDSEEDESNKSEEDDSKSSEEEASSSSEDDHRRKKSSKRQKQKKHRRKRGGSSSSSSSEEEESSSDESERERKRRAKHKKRKHRKKTSKKKKKRKKKSEKGEKHVLSSKDLAAMTEKIREEVLKEIKENLPSVTTASTDPPKVLPQSTSDKDSDPDDLQLDYSSEEPYDEHGFHTGLSKKDSPESSKKEEDEKSKEVKENVLVILDEAVEDLDYDLEEEEEEEEEETTEEENWKRQKKDDEDSQNKIDDPTKSQPRRERGDRRASRRRDIDDHHRRKNARFDERWRGDIEGRQKHNDKERRRESEARRRSNDERRRQHEKRLTNKMEERKRSIEALSRSKSREDAHHRHPADKNHYKSEQQSIRSIHESSCTRINNSSPKEEEVRSGDLKQSVDRRDVKSSNNNNNDEHRSTSKDEAPINKRARRTSSSQHVELDLRTPFKTLQDADNTTPNDGIAMAKEIRNNVYKTDTFWREPNEKGFNPRSNVLERRNGEENEEDNRHEKQKTQSLKQLTGEEASIGKRLLKIADVDGGGGIGYRSKDMEKKKNWNVYPSTDSNYKRY